MHPQTFQIGNFAFRLEAPEDLSIPAHFRLFAADGDMQAPVYTYRLSWTDVLSVPKETPYATREDLLIYRNGTLETRLLQARGHEGYYALCREMFDNETHILLDRTQEELFALDTVFSSLFALERRMLERDGLILHCAYLRHGTDAILFSAPSGAGKSTQASLWETYQKAKLINGDRCLLLHGSDGVLFANGWPVCGSSEVCLHQTLPVRAIVMLGQAPDNTIRRLSPIQAFSELYGQITINGWEPSAPVKASALLETIVCHVPVYHLDCTISREAVELTRRTIYGEA